MCICGFHIDWIGPETQGAEIERKTVAPVTPGCQPLFLRRSSLKSGIEKRTLAAAGTLAQLEKKLARIWEDMEEPGVPRRVLACLRAAEALA